METELLPFFIEFKPVLSSEDGREINSDYKVREWLNLTALVIMRINEKRSETLV